MAKFEHVDDLVEIIVCRAALHELSDGGQGTFDGLGNLVNILRLDDCVQVILEDLREIVLQFIAAEVWHGR